jgi:hypothetical protein
VLDDHVESLDVIVGGGEENGRPAIPIGQCFQRGTETQASLEVLCRADSGYAVNRCPASVVRTVDSSLAEAVGLANTKEVWRVFCPIFGDPEVGESRKAVVIDIVDISAGLQKKPGDIEPPAKER